jgi:hypothetical protein
LVWVVWSRSALYSRVQLSVVLFVTTTEETVFEENTVSSFEKRR